MELVSDKISTTLEASEHVDEVNEKLKVLFKPIAEQPAVSADLVGEARRQTELCLTISNMDPSRGEVGLQVALLAGSDSCLKCTGTFSSHPTGRNILAKLSTVIEGLKKRHKVASAYKDTFDDVQKKLELASIASADDETGLPGLSDKLLQYFAFVRDGCDRVTELFRDSFLDVQAQVAGVQQIVAKTMLSNAAAARPSSPALINLVHVSAQFARLPIFEQQGAYSMPFKMHQLWSLLDGLHQLDIAHKLEKIPDIDTCAEVINKANSLSAEIE